MTATNLWVAYYRDGSAFTVQGTTDAEAAERAAAFVILLNKDGDAAGYNGESMRRMTRAEVDRYVDTGELPTRLTREHRARRTPRLAAGGGRRDVRRPRPMTAPTPLNLVVAKADRDLTDEERREAEATIDADLRRAADRIGAALRERVTTEAVA
jgi:hypothetical protein